MAAKKSFILSNSRIETNIVQKRNYIFPFMVLVLTVDGKEKRSDIFNPEEFERYVEYIDSGNLKSLKNRLESNKQNAIYKMIGTFYSSRNIINFIEDKVYRICKWNFPDEVIKKKDISLLVEESIEYIKKKNYPVYLMYFTKLPKGEADTVKRFDERGANYDLRILGLPETVKLKISPKYKVVYSEVVSASNFLSMVYYRRSGK